MELTRNCPACKTAFSPTVNWQECCTEKCANRLRVRRYRAKHRKKGGGGGGGNGGGGGPMLFEELKLVDPTANLIPVIGPSDDPGRKPSLSARPNSRKAAA